MKKDLAKYFSAGWKGRFLSMPLYKSLTALGLCAAILVGAGGSAAALAISGSGQPQNAVSAEAMAAAEPTPSPTPAPTPKDVPLSMEISVIQQDIGVAVYRPMENTTPEGESMPLLEVAAGAARSMAKAQKTQNGDEDVCVIDSTPLRGVELNVLITDKSGNTTEAALDAETGTALAEDVKPGEYTVALQQHDGYILPEQQTVTVKEKVVYKADTQAVKEKIVQASQVTESAEDSNYGNANVVAEQLKDTVRYAESSVSDESGTSYFDGKVDGNGYLTIGGKSSPYKPVYQDGKIVGAKKDSSANMYAAAFVPGAKIEFLGKAGSSKIKLLAVEGEAPQDEEITENEENPDEKNPSEGGEETGSSSSAETSSSSSSSSSSEAGSDSSSSSSSSSEAGSDSSSSSSSSSEAGSDSSSSSSSSAETSSSSSSSSSSEAGSDSSSSSSSSSEANSSSSSTPNYTYDFSSWPNELNVDGLKEKGFDGSVKTDTKKVYTGWQTLDGVRYYFDPDSHEPVKGQQVIQGIMYTFGGNGGLQSQSRGIDVSKFQGSINWSQVKASGVDFAIIRVGYRGYGSGALVEDSQFRANIQGASSAGIPVGLYFYSQAVNEEEAVEEASMVLSLCGGYRLNYPIYYDTEHVAGGRANGISRETRTACAVAFCETIRNAGYSAGVYSYASWFYNSLSYANISKYSIWIAQYRDTLDFKYSYKIWQYSSKGRVPGISANVDMNIAY